MVHNIRTIAQTHFMDAEKVQAFAQQAIAKGAKYVWQEGSQYYTNTWYANDFVDACKEAGIMRDPSKVGY